MSTKGLMPHSRGELLPMLASAFTSAFLRGGFIVRGLSWIAAELGVYLG